MKHVAPKLFVLSEIKYKTAKHENPEIRTISHNCKLYGQMLMNSKKIVKKFYFLKYAIFTISLIWYSESEMY